MRSLLNSSDTIWLRQFSHGSSVGSKPVLLRTGLATDKWSFKGHMCLLIQNFKHRLTVLKACHGIDILKWINLLHMRTVLNSSDSVWLRQFSHHSSVLSKPIMLRSGLATGRWSFKWDMCFLILNFKHRVKSSQQSLKHEETLISWKQSI